MLNEVHLKTALLFAANRKEFTKMIAAQHSFLIIKKIPIFV